MRFACLSIFVTLVLAVPTPQGSGSYTAKITIRVGPELDPLNSATACDMSGQGTFNFDKGIVGLDPVHFGRDSDTGEPTSVCGKTVKLTNRANGQFVMGVVRDRVRNFQNPGPGKGGDAQVDISPDLNIALGGNGVDNLVDSNNKEVRLLVEFV